MYQNQRFFQLDTEWSAIHLPERPNGFGVLILGDKNNFVDDYTSFWIQNHGRYQIIKYLQGEGYSVFYSNLYGSNWGSPDATKLAIQLYHVVMKNEILNDKIHILAEGMGALVALQLMNKIEEKLRSVVFLNPCIDLQAHIGYEMDHKFFYKKLIKELAFAYKINENEVKTNFEKHAPRVDIHSPNTPVKIWQSTAEKTYHPEIHSRKYHDIRNRKNKKISLSYHFSEKAFALQSISTYFNEHEKRL